MEMIFTIMGIEFLKKIKILLGILLLVCNEQA